MNAHNGFGTTTRHLSGIISAVSGTIFRKSLKQSNRWICSETTLSRVQSLEDTMGPETSAMVPEANAARTGAGTLCQTNHWQL